MLNPEITDFLVWVCQCEVATLRVRERGGVEVELQVMLLSPLHPTLEVLYANLVTVNKLAAELTVGLVEVQTIGTSQEGLHFLDVLAQLVDVACLARIVACCLDTTRGSYVALEAYYVVSLPAVQGDRSLLQGLDGLICVHTKSGIALLSNLVILCD